MNLDKANHDRKAYFFKKKILRERVGCTNHYTLRLTYSRDLLELIDDRHETHRNLRQ